jgi:hypothetical protein
MAKAKSKKQKVPKHPQQHKLQLAKKWVNA